MRFRLLTATLLTLIVAAGITLRLYKLDSESLHFDEAWNLELSTGRGSVQERVESDVILPQLPRVTALTGAPAVTSIWTHMDHVTHPPLYSVLLRLWRAAIGESDWCARLLSAVLSAACVLVFFDVLRITSGTTPALWAAVLMACAGSQIELAQQVRPYMLCLLLALLAADAVVRIEARGASWLRSIALGACVLGMVLTHYFAVGIALALFVFASMRARKAMIPIVLAGVVFLVAWGPLLWQQRGNFTATGDNWLRESADGHFINTTQRLAVLPLRLLFEPTRRTTVIGYGSILALVLPFIALRWRRDLLLWCLWIVGSVGLLLALDLARSTWHLGLVRYTLLASPAVFAVLSALTWRIPSAPIRHAIPCAALLGCLAAVPMFYYRGNPDFRGAARYLDQQIKPGDIVVFNRAGGEDFFHKVLFLGTSHASQSYPWPVVLMSKPPSAELERQLKSAPAVWVISAANEPGAAPILGDAVESDGRRFGMSIYIRKVRPRER